MGSWSGDSYDILSNLEAALKVIFLSMEYNLECLKHLYGAMSLLRKYIKSGNQ